MKRGCAERVGWRNAVWYTNLQETVLLARASERRMMSRSTTHTMTCPCGEVFEHKIYEYVNTAQHPPLPYTLLPPLLNLATYPKSEPNAPIERPFIYSDPERRLLAYV